LCFDPAWAEVLVEDTTPDGGVGRRIGGDGGKGALNGFSEGDVDGDLGANKGGDDGSVDGAGNGVGANSALAV
jgi:hypothetical protein